MTGWSTKPHPQDGSIFYVRSHNVVKWVPYKPNSPQRKKGIRGRWQCAGEYSGWENCEPPALPWMPIEGHPHGPWEDATHEDMIMVSHDAASEMYRAYLTGGTVSEQSMACLYEAITGKRYAHE